MSRCCLQALGQQRGMALISALLLLLVVTIMGVSMFRSFGMQEKIAGNVREKQRALAAAESAQQYAEWWLSNNTPPIQQLCNGLVNVNNIQICTNPPDFSVVPWTSGGVPVGVTYTPFTSNAINGNSNQLSDNGGKKLGQVTYYRAPVFYITYLGGIAAALGTGTLYQIDAVGYGGSANAVAVVESTYLVN